MNIAVAVPPSPRYHVYIDGDFLRKEVINLMKRYFDLEVSDYDFRIPPNFPIGQPEKIFFFDALPIQKDGQTAEDFEVSLNKRIEEHSQIASTPLTHVRTGLTRKRSGRGQPKLQQKGVAFFWRLRF